MFAMATLHILIQTRSLKSIKHGKQLLMLIAKLIMKVLW